MDGSILNQKIFQIHDQVLGVLRSMNLPPVPSLYKKYFNRLLSEIANDELKKAVQDTEHQTSSEVKEDITHYIDLSKRSLATFSQTHHELSAIALSQQNCIIGAPIELLREYHHFIVTLEETNKDLNRELEHSKVMVEELTQELNRALMSLATDMLTKVGNRSALYEMLQPAMIAGESKRLSLALMMIDIDNFRYLNREHGESAGDSVLYFIAQTIKSMIRESDKIFRFGGEEFAVVFNRCEQKEIMVIAEKIRQKVEKTNLIYIGQTIHITVSIGVTLHQSGDSVESLIERSEKALYCAKKSNKNCTYMYDW